MISEGTSSDRVVHLSSAKFLAGTASASALVLILGRVAAIPSWVLAAEVLVTVLALFVMGSIRYRLNKNALTYGAGMVILATFWSVWWESSGLRRELASEGAGALWRFARRWLLSLEGLDELVHADTMLFILGLTFFVAVVGQTRLLETLSFMILRKKRGRVGPTVALIAAAVAFASGILDGVSMIGLLIRTLVIITVLAGASKPVVVYAVMLSTVVTTICGMWLAYGEPPNLIMKSNLRPHLDDAFFLNYCLPGAAISFLIVLWNVRRKFGKSVIDTGNLDVLDDLTADVRFHQAARFGEVFSPLEFARSRREGLGEREGPVLERLRAGVPLGRAMVLEGVPEAARKNLLAQYARADLAEALDEHYLREACSDGNGEARERVREAFRAASGGRVRAQRIAAAAFLPFVALLGWHAVDHDVPLFLSSVTAFAVALTALVRVPPARRLALREAAHEYSEYLFLLPLFLSITLLQKTGFFETASALVRGGVDHLGVPQMAFLQFAGTTFLSAILDNNVVADFAGRALHGLSVGLIHLFAMAQIAGYAVGGCWTHLGSAQSVMAYAYIRRNLDEDFTPFQWIKSMTPVVLEIFVALTAMVCIRGLLLG